MSAKEIILRQLLKASISHLEFDVVAVEPRDKTLGDHLPVAEILERISNGEEIGSVEFDAPATESVNRLFGKPSNEGKQ